ncbi:LysR family transcriptional regulator [Nioella aestuarii]|uniref:LysR family transcriptional regulator n=1 Tax=Nioella aestuarii TaxID=1662864 RepID=UPI003D7F7773
MDWLTLPPLNSLRAFSAVAESGSFSRAADRLNVTPAAVSQQVRLLEDRLNVALVTRSGRGLALSPEGVALAKKLDSGFAQIFAGVAELTEAEVARPLQVTMSPAFATEWFMPRVTEFQTVHPEIPLVINPTAEVIELRPGGVDVAIRYHDLRRPKPAVHSLVVSDMIIVATPELIEGRDVSTPAALVALPWLQELGTNEAAGWLTFHGVIPETPLTVTNMPGHLIMDAVRRGDGITYSARAFFREDLKAGRVVALFSESGFGNYYVETGDGHLRPTVRCFVNWLMRQAETVRA